jgi:hypothetical protein
MYDWSHPCGDRTEGARPACGAQGLAWQRPLSRGLRRRRARRRSLCPILLLTFECTFPCGMHSTRSMRLLRPVLRWRCSYSTAAAAPVINASSVPAPHCGSIRILSLNRPAARNAISRQLLAELDHHITSIHNEGESGPTRALILASDVDSSFCAGADLKERAGFTGQECARASTLRMTGQLTCSQDSQLPRFLARHLLVAVRAARADDIRRGSPCLWRRARTGPDYTFAHIRVHDHSRPARDATRDSARCGRDISLAGADRTGSGSGHDLDGTESGCARGILPGSV